MTARACSVCAHPERTALDVGLRAGVPARRLAEQHDVSRHALSRHRTNGHLAERTQTPAVPGWTPAFPGQRPPFQPGHELTLRHGAYSPRRVEPRAAELVATIVGDPDLGYLAAPRFRPAVWSWARAETRVQLLDEWLDDNGSIGVTSEGDVLPVLVALRLWSVRASNALGRLGLDPASAAKLGRNIAAASVDVATLMAGMAAEQLSAGVIDDEGEG